MLKDVSSIRGETRMGVYLELTLHTRSCQWLRSGTFWLRSTAAFRLRSATLYWSRPATTYWLRVDTVSRSHCLQLFVAKLVAPMVDASVDSVLLISSALVAPSALLCLLAYCSFNARVSRVR